MTADTTGDMGCRLPCAGSTLRARSNEFKAELMASFEDKFGAALEAGRLKPIIDQVSPISVSRHAPVAGPVRDWVPSGVSVLV